MPPERGADVGALPATRRVDYWRAAGILRAPRSSGCTAAAQDIARGYAGQQSCAVVNKKSSTNGTHPAHCATLAHGAANGQVPSLSEATASRQSLQPNRSVFANLEIPPLPLKPAAVAAPG